MQRLKTTFTLGLAILPALVFAHEGHSHFHADEILHYLATPHVLPLLAATVLTVVLAVRWKRAKTTE